jgi:hypothetical protein
MIFINLMGPPCRFRLRMHDNLLRNVHTKFCLLICALFLQFGFKYCSVKEANITQTMYVYKFILKKHVIFLTILKSIEKVHSEWKTRENRSIPDSKDHVRKA